MIKKQLSGLAMAFIIIALSIMIVQPSHSATTIFFDAPASGPLANVTGFEVEILPVPANVGIDNTDFVANFPSGWIAGSANTALISFTNLPLFNNPLTTSTLGSFTAGGQDLNVILDNWELSTVATGILAQGTDYFVLPEGNNYVITSVPIPGSILLLGSGLVGLIGLARRKRS